MIMLTPPRGELYDIIESLCLQTINAGGSGLSIERRNKSLVLYINWSLGGTLYPKLCFVDFSDPSNAHKDATTWCYEIQQIS